MRKLKSKRKKKVSTIDPFCNIASRREMVVAKQNQMNEAPKDPDDQPMTKKLQEMIKLMESKKRQGVQKKKVKRLQEEPFTMEQIGKRGRKRKKRNSNNVPCENEDSDVDVSLTPKEEAKRDKLKRYPGESDKKFLRRVRTEADQQIRDQMDEINLLGKHQKDVLEKPEKKKASNRDKERLQRLKEKKKKKQIEKKIDNLEDQYFKDRVEFGETAPRPPELSFQPRKSKASNTAGQRNLLLTSLMERGTSQSQVVAKGSVQKKTQRHKFKRRKDMDNGEKRQFDSMRQEAILAYRQAKANAMAQRTING